MYYVKQEIYSDKEIKMLNQAELNTYTVNLRKAIDELTEELEYVDSNYGVSV